MPVHAEVQALVSLAGEHHDGAAVLAHLDDLRPQTVANASAHATAVDPRADLQQPARQVSTEAGWACGEHDHYHGGTSSLKFCPAATRPFVSQSSTTSTVKSASLSPSDPISR